MEWRQEHVVWINHSLNVDVLLSWKRCLSKWTLCVRVISFPCASVQFTREATQLHIVQVKKQANLQSHWSLYKDICWEYLPYWICFIRCMLWHDFSAWTVCAVGTEGYLFPLWGNRAFSSIFAKSINRCHRICHLVSRALLMRASAFLEELTEKTWYKVILTFAYCTEFSSTFQHFSLEAQTFYCFFFLAS